MDKTRRRTEAKTMQVAAIRVSSNSAGSIVVCRASALLLGPPRALYGFAGASCARAHFAPEHGPLVVRESDHRSFCTAAGGARTRLQQKDSGRMVLMVLFEQAGYKSMREKPLVVHDPRMVPYRWRGRAIGHKRPHLPFVQ
jgi:hypothetical protein